MQEFTAVLSLVLVLVPIGVCWLVLDYMFGDRVIIELMHDIKKKLGR